MRPALMPARNSLQNSAAGPLRARHFSFSKHSSPGLDSSLDRALLSLDLSSASRWISCSLTHSCSHFFSNSRALSHLPGNSLALCSRRIQLSLPPRLDLLGCNLTILWYSLS